MSQSARRRNRLRQGRRRGFGGTSSMSAMGFGRRGISRATVRCETSNPSFSNSPWMRGAPQSGFASAMVRTRSASSPPTRGLPTRPRRDFQVQKARKLCRCQRITVCGFTTWSTSLHRVHHCESHIQKARSSSPNFGRFDLRRSRASCCRSARFSSVRSVRVLSAARRAPNRTSTRDIALPGSLTVAHRPAGTEFWQGTTSFSGWSRG